MLTELLQVENKGLFRQKPPGTVPQEGMDENFDKVARDLQCKY